MPGLLADRCQSHPTNACIHSACRQSTDLDATSGHGVWRGKLPAGGGDSRYHGIGQALRSVVRKLHAYLCQNPTDSRQLVVLCSPAILLTQWQQEAAARHARAVCVC
jgi:hypothetical protein